jgi:DinB family
VPIVDALLPEFDHEMTTTRKLLERVPDDKFEWQPHPKSMSLGRLSTHLATLPWWGEVTLNQTFDKNVAKARAILVSKSDAEMMVPWSLKRGGQTIFSMPRVAVWRSFVVNHIIHHRGQLSVFLRLNDVPVPSIYGPSADEGTF